MEEFRDIPGYEGHYQVSNLGNVKSLKVGIGSKGNIILKSQKSKCGYCRVGLHLGNKLEMKSIHRLLMMTFKPDEYFDGAHVNHINGIKTDNRLENLEWVTRSENMKHADITGLRKHKNNTKHHRSKVNNKIVSIIKLAYKNKYFNQYELAEIFNLSQTHISHLVNNKRWLYM